MAGSPRSVKGTPPFPAHNGDAWQVVIGGGGQPIPETKIKIHLSDFNGGVKWDVKDGPGVADQTASFHGPKVAIWKIKIETGWRRGSQTEADTGLLFWKLMWSLCRAMYRGDPMQVSHPVLDLNDIHSMFLTSVRGPSYDGQLLVAEFDCMEWTKPAKSAKNVSKTPTGPNGEIFGKVPDVFLTHDSSGAVPPPKPSATKPKP